jgi:CRP/FNR family cyclic AMP-dependent transcriptional regulator
MGNDDTALFSELTPEHLETITAHGVQRQYPKNTILITEGDQSDSLYVVREGQAKAYVSDEHGKEFTLSILGPGQHFGELALIDATPRSASVVTMTPCRMTVVSKADFRQCLAEDPEIAMELIRSLSQRYRALTERVRNLALLDVYGRVARTLLSMATDTDGEQIIEQRLTHQEIASMVGASREMVSRIMKDLTTGGYVEMRDRRIVIRSKLPPAW